MLDVELEGMQVTINRQPNKKGRMCAPRLMTMYVDRTRRTREASRVRWISERQGALTKRRARVKAVMVVPTIRQALTPAFTTAEPDEHQVADECQAEGWTIGNIENEQQGTGREQTQTQDERDRIADREWPTWGFDSRVSHEIALRFACETRHQVYYVRRCQVLHGESPLIGREADRRPSPTRGGGAAGRRSTSLAAGRTSCERDWA